MEIWQEGELAILLASQEAPPGELYQGLLQIGWYIVFIDIALWAAEKTAQYLH